MASPNITAGAAGNVIANIASVGAGATSSAGTISFTAGDLEYRFQLKGTFGTVAATYGLYVNAYQTIGATPSTDTIGFYVSPTLQKVNGTDSLSFVLPAGNYSFTIVNTDATNAVTNVTLTADRLTQ
jgi:hypothetical protein